MNSTAYHPWLHRAALATAVLALLPIVVGALVTTLDAGMAFPDWPSSDGQGMLTYPWLKSAGDEFIEHGHRLAGMLIGVVSIGLTAVAWRVEERRWVRWLATAVLLGVIAQGLLGGGRVLLDRRTLAMTHGSFAALVFATMGVLVLVTGRTWCRLRESVALDSGRQVEGLLPLAVITCIGIAGQYLLGGVIRHLATGLHEHLGGAVVVSLLVLATLIAGVRTRIGWLARPAIALFALLLLQASLGAGAWVTRFGFATTGYVAVQHAPLQIAVRSAHTVVGMLVFMTSVIYAVRLFRVHRLQLEQQGAVRRQASVTQTQEAAGLVTAKGGVA